MVSRLTSDQSLRAVVLSSSAIFLAVVAVIWVDEVYIYFLLGLMIPAQLQAFRGAAYMYMLIHVNYHVLLHVYTSISFALQLFYLLAC